MDISFFPTTVEKRLRIYAIIADAIITIGLFTYIFSEKLNVREYFFDSAGRFTTSRILEFLAEKGELVILALLMTYVFVAWRFLSRMEMDIAVSLFPSARAPQEWKRVEGHESIHWLILAFYLIFIIIAYFIDNIIILSAALAGLYIVALRSQILRVKNLKKYFSDSRFSPRDADEHKTFILRRRKVAELYLFSGRHVVKETLVAVAATVAALYAICIYAIEQLTWNWISYTIIVATILINEIVTLRWRIVRQRLLWQIDEDQEKADRDRVAGSFE